MSRSFLAKACTCWLTELVCALFLLLCVLSWNVRPWWRVVYDCRRVIVGVMCRWDVVIDHGVVCLWTKRLVGAIVVNVDFFGVDCSIFRVVVGGVSWRLSSDSGGYPSVFGCGLGGERWR